MDIEEVTIDPSASWVPVEKVKDTAAKEDEGEVVDAAFSRTSGLETRVEIWSDILYQ